MKTAFPPLVALLLASSVGCSANAPSADLPADAGAPRDAAGPGAPDDAAPEAALDAAPACNDLSPAAATVDYSLSDLATPPAGTGGTIVDGTYDLTGYTIYGAGSVGAGFTANQSTSIALVIAGGSWSQVQVFDIENTTSTVNTNYSAAAADASVTLTPTCPSGPATTGTYTATPTALELVTRSSGFVISETFAKQ
jgi:hypothetical protein